MAGELRSPEWEAARQAADSLSTLANELGASPAALAIAFAAANPRVASVLFGATTVEQVAENAAAIELLDRLAPADLDDLRAIGLEA